jgi:Tfp pilus assembly protein PilN
VIETTLNLLPAHLLRRREDQRRGRGRVLLAVAVVLPIVVAYAMIHARTEALRFESAALTRQIGALTPLALKARKLDGDVAALRERESALSRVRTGLPHWSQALVELRNALPPDAWLTSITIADGQLAVVGHAQNERGLSAVTTSLASARFLTGASLKFVREEDAGPRRTYGFEIDATLRRDAP